METCREKIILEELKSYIRKQ